VLDLLGQSLPVLTVESASNHDPKHSEPDRDRGKPRNSGVEPGSYENDPGLRHIAQPDAKGLDGRLGLGHGVRLNRIDGVQPHLRLQRAARIEARADDATTGALVAAIDDPDTATAVTAERAFLGALDGSCRTPIAAHARVEKGFVRFRGMIVTPDGGEALDVSRDGPRDRAAAQVSAGASGGKDGKEAVGGSPVAAPAASKASPSLLDGVTRSLPATLEGFQLTRKASRIGFDWDEAQDVLAKVREESAEIQKALATESREGIEEELGDLLFAAVNLARFLKIDPEIALKRANGKFSSRFRAMEAMARESGRELAVVPRPEMEELWDRAKQNEKRETRQRSARAVDKGTGESAGKSRAAAKP